MCLFAVWTCTFFSCLHDMSYQCHIMRDNSAVVSLQGCHVTCHTVSVMLQCVCHNIGYSHIPMLVSCQITLTLPVHSLSAMSHVMSSMSSDMSYYVIAYYFVEMLRASFVIAEWRA